MTTLPRRKIKLNYQQVLHAAQELSLRDQQRLRDELARQAGVYLLRPTGTAAAMRQGRRLAKKIQTEVAGALGDSLDEAMMQLRGRSWSS